MSGRLQTQLRDIGDMSDLVGFATVTNTVDAWGAMSETATTPTADIPAMVRFDSTNEAQGIAQEKLTTQIKVWVRYDSSYTELKQVYWNSKWYDIYAIEWTPGQRFHVIKARIIET